MRYCTESTWLMALTLFNIILDWNAPLSPLAQWQKQECCHSDNRNKLDYVDQFRWAIIWERYNRYQPANGPGFYQRLSESTCRIRQYWINKFFLKALTVCVQIADHRFINHNRFTISGVLTIYNRHTVKLGSSGPNMNEFRTPAYDYPWSWSRFFLS